MNFFFLLTVFRTIHNHPKIKISSTQKDISQLSPSDATIDNFLSGENPLNDKKSEKRVRFSPASALKILTFNV